jgi:hypothetical protein
MVSEWTQGGAPGFAGAALSGVGSVPAKQGTRHCVHSLKGGTMSP